MLKTEEQNRKRGAINLSSFDCKNICNCDNGILNIALGFSTIN